jgi:UDP-N-acetylmuramoylalanine--D-glutamate ligase
MSALLNRSVLVLGLGESGLAMARWCHREGATVRVADTRADPPKRAELVTPLDASFDVRTGGFADDLLDGIDLIAISPGLAPTGEPQSALLATARTRGIEVVGEIELFARKLAALGEERGYVPRVVAITGTNGKTTVTKLVGRLCETANVAVVVAGNVSPAALDALGDALDRNDLPAVWVLELSSFQLVSTTSLVATAATVLNITQDHLDWHGTMDAYAAAKATIFAPVTVRVLNRDDERVIEMDATDAPSVRFGLDVPTLPGDFGVVVDGDEEGLRWLALAEGEEPEVDTRRVNPKKVAVKRRVAKVVPVEPLEPVRIKRLMPVDALQIRGDHNVANALAALGLGRAIGLPMGAMLRALAAYRGEPHRVELIRTIDGVDYIEDSKGTNVGATVAALNGLRRKVVLIAGGLGKGQDFTPLAGPVATNARAVFLIGRDRGAIAAALSGTGVPIVECASLEEAVDEAAVLAEPGDAVLLSPACASMDMFRDYAHRAAAFVAAVERLAEGEEAVRDVAEGATC